MQRPTNHMATVAATPERLAEVLWAVERVSHGWSAVLNCLPRAVAVRSMMARRHWESELMIGVAIAADGSLRAHAWVEHCGKIVIGDMPDLEQYEKLPFGPNETTSPPYPKSHR